MDEMELQDNNQEPEQAAGEAAPAVEEAPEEAEQMQPMQAGEEEAPEAPAEQAAEEVAPAAAAAGEAEDQEEEQEEVEEQNEQEANPPDAQQPAQGEELAGDAVNQEIAAVAAEAGVEENDEEETGDPDRAFDTLKDLENLKGEGDNENGEGDDKDTKAEVIQARKSVMQLRKGNLYKAVIFSKMLENGENPAGEEKELETKKAAAGGGRFSRFLNNSKLDKAGKVVKLTNAANGLAGMVDSDFKKSRFATLTGKANDILILINSIRGIIKKLKAFKQNSTSPTKKAFAVIGLVSDFGMAVSKGAAIAKNLFARRGWNGLAGLMGRLSSFAGMAGQIATLINVSNSLKELVQATAPIKKAQKEEEANVLAILQKYEIEGAAAGDAQQGQQETEKGKGKGKEKKASKSRRLGKKNALKEKVLSAMERPDISKEDKAVLASYLGRGRILSKRKLAIANVATGLVTVSLGMGATFSKNAASRTQGEAQASALKHAGRFGALTNLSVLGSALGTHIAGKKVNKGLDDREGGLIKEGLYGALHDLGSDDKYGLRKVSATLAPKDPTPEHLQEAQQVMKRYETATKQFQGSGVNYAQLFKATNTEAFKNSLIASL